MLNNNDNFIDKLYGTVSRDRVLTAEPMSRHTTFRIGGPADYLVSPASMEEIAVLRAIAIDCGLPVTILGNGSNVLVRDKGIRGLVIKIGRDLGHISLQNGNTIIAGAGALLSTVSRFAAEAGLGSMEFASGIPGSIGGAIYMNAGAYGGEISNIVAAVSAISAEGQINRFSASQIDFGYRHSAFQQNLQIIGEVELCLPAADKQAIAHKISDYTARRLAKQPVDMPSAGSTFKRPPGFFAGTLIEQTGLKGLAVGGAMVSMKHAGFIVNTGGATAEDVLSLIALVQAKVRERFDVLLQPEVKVLGEL